MAYVSRLSDYVRGGVVGETIQEGRAVRLTTSGVRNELPVLMLAVSGQIRNVFCLMAVPDKFPRPTIEGLYTAPRTAIFPAITNDAGWGLPTESGVFYRQGKSTFENPTLYSGELGQAHRGGTYAVPSGDFVDVAGIRIPGALIEVGASGMWQLTASEATAVGYVEEYQPVNSHLVFTLYQ